MVVGPGGLLLDDRVTPSSTPEDIEFREEVLDCFPEADSHLGYPLPEHLPQVRSTGVNDFVQNTMIGVVLFIYFYIF